MNENPHINFLHKENNFDNPEKPRRSRWIFFILGILILILGVTGVAAISSRNEGALEYDPVTLEPKRPEGLFKKLSYLVFRRDLNLEGEKNDRINVLLLGMGGPGHDGPYLTDTIMIASIKPSTNEIALISIPRDFGIPIKNKGVYKINHANSFGETEKPGWGGAYATEVIEDAFDIDIPYYLRLDFTAFEEIIDEVGGVRIEVKKTFTDYQYPAPKEQYQTVTFKAGPQTMDGDMALKYARSRHGNNGEGSDFARARRQQEILLALKQKVLSFSTLTNPLRIKKIMDSLEDNLTTNMQFDEIIELAKLARELNTATIRTLVLDSSPNGFLVNATGIDGAFLLSPKSGSFNDINDAIKNIFDSGAEITSTSTTTITPDQSAPIIPEKVQASIEIQNGTWSAGLAALAKEQLTKIKLYTDEVGNSKPEIKPFKKSTIYLLDPSVEDTARTIEKELEIPIETTLPSDVSLLNVHSNILIILGEDFIES